MPTVEPIETTDVANAAYKPIVVWTNPAFVQHHRIEVRSMERQRELSRKRQGPLEPFVLGALRMVAPDSASEQYPFCAAFFGGVEEFAARIVSAVTAVVPSPESGNCSSIDKRCGLGEFSFTRKIRLAGWAEILEKALRLNSLIVGKLTLEYGLNLHEVFRDELASRRVAQIAEWLTAVASSNSRSEAGFTAQSEPHIEQTSLLILSRALRELDTASASLG